MDSIPRLHLQLLGTFRLTTDDGSQITIAMRKPRALLAYLALHPRQPQTRDRVAGLLWPECATRQAHISVRQALFVLRRALEPRFRGALADVDGHIVLDPARIVVDVVGFETYAREDRPRALAIVADLYGGDLLQGLDVDEEPFDEWLVPERERLRESAIEVLARLLRHPVDNDEDDAAIAGGARLPALDPCQEAVHRTLMRVYARGHRRAAALRQYEACAAALRRDFDLTPDEETEALYRRIAGAPELARAARALAAV